MGEGVEEGKRGEMKGKRGRNCTRGEEEQWDGSEREGSMTGTRVSEETFANKQKKP